MSTRDLPVSGLIGLPDVGHGAAVGADNPDGHEEGDAALVEPFLIAYHPLVADGAANGAGIVSRCARVLPYPLPLGTLEKAVGRQSPERFRNEPRSQSQTPRWLCEFGHDQQSIEPDDA
jgi:hypothetical protein